MLMAKERSGSYCCSWFYCQPILPYVLQGVVCIVIVCSKFDHYCLWFDGMLHLAVVSLIVDYYAILPKVKDNVMDLNNVALEMSPITTDK